MKFANKIVVVTGGTSGIGLAAAALFRDEGAKATPFLQVTTRHM